jgi:hypothetical protein
MQAVSVIGLILVLAILFLWIGLLYNMATPNSSDAAGNGLAGVYMIFFAAAIWIMLAILLILAGINGEMPGWTAAVAFLLVPASGVAAVTAGAMIAELDKLGVEARWLLVVPALVPPLLIFFALWAYQPSLRESIPASVAGGGVWGLVLILSILPWPMVTVRANLSKTRFAGQEKAVADARVEFAKLTPESPLWEWAPFVDSPMQVEALNHIRTAPNRQADAEIMLERGDFPMRLLFELSLDPTPELCRKFHAFLAKREESMRLKVPRSQSITVIASDLDAAINSMSWLADHQCDCRDLGAAYLATANSYKDLKLAAWDLHQLESISQGSKP